VAQENETLRIRKTASVDTPYGTLEVVHTGEPYILRHRNGALFPAMFNADGTMHQRSQQAVLTMMLAVHKWEQFPPERFNVGENGERVEAEEVVAEWDELLDVSQGR